MAREQSSRLVQILGGKHMQAEQSEALEADDMARLYDIERRIRLLINLREQASLEADAYCQLARIAAAQSDIRAAQPGPRSNHRARARQTCLAVANKPPTAIVTANHAP